MFRARKKKALNRRAVRKSDSDDAAEEVGTNAIETGEDQRSDTDEQPSSLLMTLQQRKIEKRNRKKAKGKRETGSKGGLIVRSFDPEEADDDDRHDDQKKRKKKKRKRGLGFGGGDISMHLNELSQNADTEANHSKNTYGKEALEQLKSEQKRQTLPRAPLKSTTSPNAAHLTTGGHNGANRLEESYIPLEHPDEENDKSGESHGWKSHQEKEKVLVVDGPPKDEAANGWERQIEQRAGIKSSSMSSKASSSKLLSLEELSQKLTSTVESIDRQREELENSTNRLRADREHALVASKEYQEGLKKTGLACEFYQSTRRDLTLWVGALRDLQKKVQPIVTAFEDMLLTQVKEFSHDFRTWQDDCVATLYQANRLDRVLGRQIESTLLTTASNEIVYDEFGRDVRSQHLRDRELRFKKQMDYIHRQENASVDSSIGIDVIECESHDEEERSKILREALGAALEDLDQGYTSATKLKTVFDTWFGVYHDDYQQCYATLSFGDLYAILVEVDVCKSQFFPNVLSSLKDTSGRSSQRPILQIENCFLGSSSNQDTAEYNSDKSKTNKAAIENDGRLRRVVEKGVLPMLEKILNYEDEDAYDSFFIFYSTTKSFHIAKLINDAVVQPLQQVQSSCLDGSPSNSNSLTWNLQRRLQNLISSAIKNALGGISIPLLIKGSDISKLGENNVDDENQTGSPATRASECSVRFASVYLVQTLQRALYNIIIHWLPLIDIDSDSNSLDDNQVQNGIHFVLNFINDKYLVLLSSLENAEETSSEISSPARMFFKPVWEALNKDSRNIVESPALMLSTMPLRAVARAYQLN